MQIIIGDSNPYHKYVRVEKRSSGTYFLFIVLLLYLHHTDKRLNIQITLDLFFTSTQVIDYSIRKRADPLGDDAVYRLFTLRIRAYCSVKKVKNHQPSKGLMKILNPFMYPFYVYETKRFAIRCIFINPWGLLA